MDNALDFIRNRRPRFNQQGRITGFRSTPGAPQSPRDSMANLTGGVGDRPLLGGLSSSSTWDSFFKKPEQSIAPISLGPVTPIDAPEMAQAYDESAFFEDAAPEPSNPQSYMKAAMKNAEGYFGGSNLGRQVSGSTNQLRPKFAGSATPAYDYEDKLKRLTATSTFGDSLFF